PPWARSWWCCSSRSSCSISAERAVASSGSIEAPRALPRAATVADASPLRMALERAGPPLLRLAVALIYAFLLVPILISLPTSSNATQSTPFPPTGFSLRWYGAFLASAGFVDAFKFSIGLGVAAAVIATAIGFVSAYAIVRFLGRWRNLGH